MNETEKDRILRMVSEGVIRPAEAASLLAALAEDPAETKADVKSKSDKSDSKSKEQEKEKLKTPLMEVQMQRPDGTHYTVQVPPNLFPMFWQMAKVAMKEAARSAAQDTWAGMKTMARNKTAEVKSSVRSRVGAGKTPTPTATPSTPAQDTKFEARRTILQMIQNGRISADDAGRLLQQLDALDAYETKHEAPATK